MNVREIVDDDSKLIMITSGHNMEGWFGMFVNLKIILKQNFG